MIRPCTAGELPDWYRAADVFVFPSLFEGFGLPPLEAMACGCPVLSSTRGALAPVVRAALASLGASLPRRLPALLARARAGAATLHHSLASPAAIARAHELDAAVYVWTVDDPTLAERLVRAGADGIITNDPRIFAALTP